MRQRALSSLKGTGLVKLVPAQQPDELIGGDRRAPPALLTSYPGREERSATDLTCGAGGLDARPVTVVAVTSLEVVLVMVGVPLAIMVVLGLLTLGPPFVRARRSRPGRQ